MAWEVIDKDDVARFIRVKESFIEDAWYDMAIGIIERFTHWSSLNATTTATNLLLDGYGSSVLVPTYIPINTITSIYVYGTLLPSTYYIARWDGIYLRSYVEDESIDLTLRIEAQGIGRIFPFGIGNVKVTYNYGGIASLPDYYQQAIKTGICLIVKELSIIPRNEGSDAYMKEYRPEKYSQDKEEILKSYGIHGKINGILSAILPRFHIII